LQCAVRMGACKAHEAHVGPVCDAGKMGVHMGAKVECSLPGERALVVCAAGCYSENTCTCDKAVCVCKACEGYEGYVARGVLLGEHVAGDAQRVGCVGGPRGCRVLCGTSCGRRVRG